MSIRLSVCLFVTFGGGMVGDTGRMDWKEGGQWGGRISTLLEGGGGGDGKGGQEGGGQWGGGISQREFLGGHTFPRATLGHQASIHYTQRLHC